ncbi:Integrase catalytic domain-containing protein [Aphis craccivora]|uniref:Integrase catalytic domain-containing protein n=1 Tax=Aphis craccivora TaxID=307492 RepID=A0A6G0VHR5_APHCR|nr:Integrase catalytic domain-containing protein [Aphis craccivora]
MTSKSIHLEVVSDLTTEGFIATLKRVVSRRGYLISILTTTLTLRSLYNCLFNNEFQKPISTQCVSININWHFNPPVYPHHDEKFILNIRPLCEIDDGTVLTPGHFIIGHPLLAVLEDDIGPIANHRKCWNILQKITQTYWKQWSSTYLINLQQRSKWWKPQDDLAVGDIVILSETGTPTQWLMAHVLEVFTDPAKNQVRVVYAYAPQKLNLYILLLNYRP